MAAHFMDDTPQFKEALFSLQIAGANLVAEALVMMSFYFTPKLCLANTCIFRTQQIPIMMAIVE